MTTLDSNAKTRTAPKLTEVDPGLLQKARMEPEKVAAELYVDKAVRELVCRSCMTLDRMDFDAYMELCHPDYEYVISTYSPELRKDIIWLQHDWDGMKILFDVLPKHVSDNLIRLRLSRHVTVYTVDHDAAQSRADVASALQVFTTTLDGGVTELLSVAMYYDTVNLEGPRPLLLSRKVDLQTRMLGETGSHIPF